MFFRWCVEHGYTASNPVEGVEKPRLEQKIPAKLTKQDALRLIEVVYNYPYEYKYLRYRNHAIFSIFVFAGLHKNELLNLQFGDVDIDNLTIFVRQGKGRKDRMIPISYTLAHSLRRYLDERKRLGKTCTQFFASLRGNEGFTVDGLHFHQDLQQLQREDGELLNSVLGNVYTRIVFRVGEPDARKLKDGFASFDVADLQNLGRGEAVVRIEQPQYDCSLNTVQLAAVSKEVKEERLQAVTDHSRSVYAQKRSAVEAVLAEMLAFEVPEPEPPAVKKESPKKDPVQHIQAPAQIDKTIIVEPSPSAANDAEQERDISTHRYLQTLIKKMAEARGYVATLEAATPDHTGSVDVLLARDGKTIAVEICSTTDAEWEMHNLAKCIKAGYTTVISVCGDIRQLDKIKQKCISGLPGFDHTSVHFLTPNAVFEFLDSVSNPAKNTEATMKGYRVSVSYDSMTDEEMTKKRASVAQVVLNSMKKKKMK